MDGLAKTLLKVLNYGRAAFVCGGLIAVQNAQATTSESAGSAGEQTPDPMQQFWTQPSVTNWIAVGEHLMLRHLGEREYALERQDRVPQRPPVAEFDAMKQRLQQGIVVRSDLAQSWVRLQDFQQLSENSPPALQPWWNEKSLPLILSLLAQNRLPSIAPSFFKSTQDVLPVGTRSVDALASLAGAELRLTDLQGPIAVEDDDNGFSYAAIWDVGRYTLQLSKPLLRYAVNRDGSLSAQQGRTFELSAPVWDGECGDSYAPLYPVDAEELPGYAPSQDEVAEFFAAQPLTPRVADVISTVLNIRQSNADGLAVVSPLVVHQVDLDRDEVVDLVKWSGTYQGNDYQGELPWWIQFANVGGAWQVAAYYQEEMCGC